MRALIVVDVQNDFLPGGALAVGQGDAVIPVINRLQPRFEIVVATKDWHPPDHLSFAANHPGKKVHDPIELGGLAQTLWPVHCVQNTPGAELARALEQKKIGRIFHKGIDREIDSYSGFFDNGHRRSTGMGEWLKRQGVSDVYVCGLATDYCVKFSALDALMLGYRTFVVEDACRGVGLKPGDISSAIEEMKRAGAIVLRSTDLEKV